MALCTCCRVAVRTPASYASGPGVVLLCGNCDAPNANLTLQRLGWFRNAR